MGVVTCYEYVDYSGYGNETRLFLCKNLKHESISIIRQTKINGEWLEEHMTFDSDSFIFLDALLNNYEEDLGGDFTLVRDCN